MSPGVGRGAESAIDNRFGNKKGNASPSGAFAPRYLANMWDSPPPLRKVQHLTRRCPLPHGRFIGSRLHCLGNHHSAGIFLYKRKRGMLPKESLLRQHEHDRQKESIMTHASLNIHEPKWNVNRSQRPTPYIPKTDTLTSQRPTPLHVTIKADKTWESNRHKAASGKADAGRGNMPPAKCGWERYASVWKGTLQAGQLL